MIDFLETYGTLILAAVALVQPWLWGAYRRWLRTGQVQIYETGKIELGYGASGASVALWGTLRGRLEDVFVRRMEVKIVRQSDRATHKFDWAAFRVGAFGSQPTLSFPYSFNLLKGDAKPFNIVFNASAIESEIQALLLPIRDAWLHHPINVELRQMLATEAEVAEGSSARRENAWSEFTEEAMFIECHSELQRKCFWDPGRYTLDLRVYSSERRKPVVTSWEFCLDEDQSKSLRQNAIIIVNQACGASTNWRLNFVYLKYEKSGDNS